MTLVLANFGYYPWNFYIIISELSWQEPNYEDPLNHEAAAVLRENPKLFESNVRRAMAGGYVGQTYFTRCM